MERVNLNSNEKLSRVVTGIESGATHFTVNEGAAEKNKKTNNRQNLFLLYL